MNALTLIGLFLATIVVVSCGSHHHHSHHQQKHRANRHVKTPESAVAASHSFKIQHHRIPEKVREQLAKHGKGIKAARHLELPAELKHKLKARDQKFLKAKADSNSTGGSTSTIPLENWNDWLLIANITVGTPPQSLRVAMSPWDEDMYVIGVNAVENDDYDSGSWSWSVSSSSSSGGDYDVTSSSSSLSSSSSSSSSSGPDFVADCGCGDDTPKNTYNASASSTATSQNASFSADYGWVTGTLVNDVVNLGGLDLNVTLGDVDVYDWWVGYLPIDGVVGLSPSASANGIPNLLQQIAGQLAQPLVVLNTHRNFQDYMDWQDDPTEVNEITFGTENVAGCGTEWTWTSLGDLDEDAFGLVNVTSVSAAPDANGCANSVSASHPLILLNYFVPMFVSNQVQELVVQATGAQFDEDLGWYTTPCDQISQGKNVNLNLEDGGSVTVTPADVHVQYDDVCYLFVYGWYDEHDPSYGSQPILLGQQFANNHCVGYNIATNSLGISSSGSQAKPTPSTTQATPTPTPSATSSTTEQAPAQEGSTASTAAPEQGSGQGGSTNSTPAPEQGSGQGGSTNSTPAPEQGAGQGGSTASTDAPQQGGGPQGA